MATAVLPIKDLVSAKTRLSGLLTPAERRDLAQAMAEDVLACLAAHPGIDRVFIVSDDPAAPHLAAVYGVDFIDEKTLDCHGLNAVIAATVTQLPPPADSLVMVLHGDLPALTEEDLTAALEAAKSHGLVLGSDRAGTGTNMLLFPFNAVPAFRFGANSCTHHRAWADASGVLCKNLQTSGFGFDVDMPEDLVALIERAAANGIGERTLKVLDTGLAARLTPVLESLAGDHERRKMGDSV